MALPSGVVALQDLLSGADQVLRPDPQPPSLQRRREGRLTDVSNRSLLRRRGLSEPPPPFHLIDKSKTTLAGDFLMVTRRGVEPQCPGCAIWVEQIANQYSDKFNW